MARKIDADRIAAAFSARYQIAKEFDGVTALEFLRDEQEAAGGLVYELPANPAYPKTWRNETTVELSEKELTIVAAEMERLTNV